MESMRRFFWRIAKFTILAQQRIGCLLQRQKDLICVGKHQSEPRTNVNCNFSSNKKISRTGETVCQGICPCGLGLHGLLVPMEHPYKFSSMWFITNRNYME